MHAHTTCNWLIIPQSIIQALYCRLEQQACYRKEFISEIDSEIGNLPMAAAALFMQYKWDPCVFCNAASNFPTFFHNPLVAACFRRRLRANVSAGRDLLLFCSPRWKFTPTAACFSPALHGSFSYSQFGARETVLCWFWFLMPAAPPRASCEQEGENFKRRAQDFTFFVRLEWWWYSTTNLH